LKSKSQLEEKKKKERKAARACNRRAKKNVSDGRMKEK